MILSLYIHNLLIPDFISIMFSFLFLKQLFIYFWLRWVFVAARGLSLVGGEWGLLFVVVCGLLTAVASLCCGVQALGAWASVVVARRL